MLRIDTIEGTVGNTLWCHYDVTNDTLYLRLAKDREPAHSLGLTVAEVNRYNPSNPTRVFMTLPSLRTPF